MRGSHPDRHSRWDISQIRAKYCRSSDDKLERNGDGARAMVRLYENRSPPATNSKREMFPAA